VGHVGLTTRPFGTEPTPQRLQSPVVAVDLYKLCGKLYSISFMFKAPAYGAFLISAKQIAEINPCISSGLWTLANKSTLQS
jgi:hypothetical protein